MKVYLSLLAEMKLQLLLAYIEQEWGNKSRQEFLKKFTSSVKQISSLPRSCPESKLVKGIFKCVVTRQMSFYYRTKNESIEIITVFDNRQNPHKIAEEIKKFFS